MQADKTAKARSVNTSKSLKSTPFKLVKLFNILINMIKPTFMMIHEKYKHYVW